MGTLLKDEIKTISRKNIVQARSFTKMLEQTIRKYNNRLFETAARLEELIILCEKVQADKQRSRDLGLSDDEIAFYEILVNNSAIKVRDEALKKSLAP